MKFNEPSSFRDMFSSGEESPTPDVDKKDNSFLGTFLSLADELFGEEERDTVFPEASPGKTAVGNK